MAKNNFPIIVRVQIVNKIRNAVFVVVFKLAHQGNIVALMNRRTCRTLHFYFKTFAVPTPVPANKPGRCIRPSPRPEWGGGLRTRC